MARPNDIQVSEHFKLYEFEDSAANNLVVIHALTLARLEKLRWAIGQNLNREIAIVITCGTRTKRTNRNLAKVFGWTTDGGLVSPISKHLPEFGGIAVDVYALDKSTGQIVPQKHLSVQAARFFDVVIDHYPTHTHVDLRHTLPKGTPDHEPSQQH